MRYSSDLIVESLRSQFDVTDINEAKVVTFDGKVNPNFGHAVIMLRVVSLMMNVMVITTLKTLKMFLCYIKK